MSGKARKLEILTGFQLHSRSLLQRRNECAEAIVSIGEQYFKSPAE